MPKLIPIKPKKLIRILISIGFVERDAQGSHVFSGTTTGFGTSTFIEPVLGHKVYYPAIRGSGPKIRRV